MLLFPDPRLPYTVVTDASLSATSGVLMQDQGNGLQPLAFLSRQLKPMEQRYSAYERELAVVAYCLQSWRHYLEGCPGGVTVVMDHQPLTHYMDQPVLSQVQTRWLRLGLFQSIRPTMKYQPGKANIVADVLSQSQRPTAEEPEVAPPEEEVLQLTSSSVEPQAEDLQTWKKAHQEDPRLRTVLSKFCQGLPCGGQYLTLAALLAIKQGDL